jgi:integrase
MFNYAVKRRHLPPYAENPFAVLEVDRMPIETVRRVELLTDDQLTKFLAACDRWQYPIFLTLLLTGLRPGELCHLLLPEDLDLDAGLVRVRNKPQLGWQVKTRNQRDVPLLPELDAVLRRHLAGRSLGPVFLRRPRRQGFRLANHSQILLERELVARNISPGNSCDRANRERIARQVWHEAGALAEDRVRLEFIRVCRASGLEGQTAPKLFRHQFATILQEGRVDPLVRNLLMGHASAEQRTSGFGLGMTAMYTHTRAETIRDQLHEAFRHRPWLTSKALIGSQWGTTTPTELNSASNRVTIS